MSLALLTDLYQLTMAQAHLRDGAKAILDREAVFHLYFRRLPFGGGFAIACGTIPAVAEIASLRFSSEDLDYLAHVTGNDGKPIFTASFLAHLRSLELLLDVDAVPEGTPVFPHQPLVRVRGPAMHAQLVETLLLNMIGFPTLVATKAARIVHAAAPDPVIEMGLRRAQGPDGGLIASRAAYVGGCTATSNVLAGHRFGVPLRGTHAHAWVMLHGDELSAFRAYAAAMPNNSLFLVDTYDTLDGVRNAITVGRELRAQGHELAGVRLDSGDLAELSKGARALLDEAGFPYARIVASNDLDEHIVRSLKLQGARIDVWGIGTKLVTSADTPSLGVVYKVGAVRSGGGAWTPRVKVSEQAAKVTTPGVLGARRYFDGGGAPIADVIWDEALGISSTSVVAVHASDPTRRKSLSGSLRSEELLVPVLRAGKLVAKVPDAIAARERTLSELERLPATIRRFENPQEYFVGLELGLHDRKQALVLAAREGGMS